jgi:hypothetical protein
MVQRRPAKTPGETVAMPTFIASQVVPQTKQMKTNIARCDVVDEAFIGVADVLLPRRNDSASGCAGAAPKRHGAYACGRARFGVSSVIAPGWGLPRMPTGLSRGSLRSSQ